VRQRTDERQAHPDHQSLPAPVGRRVEETGMSKKTKGNKEAKKPKQVRPALAPPVAAGPAPAVSGWPRPQRGKK
jgi:hypothetical protein